MSNDVFFLGAGFSRSIDSSYPTLKELSEHVQKKMQTDEKGSVREHYDHEIPAQLKNNVEALLSYLSADLPWKTGTQKYENLALYEKIIEYIQSYFLGKHIASAQEIKDIQQGIILPDFGLTDEKNAAIFYKFILKNNLDKNRKDIITLNYDLMSEVFLNKYKLHQTSIRNDDLYQIPIPYTETRSGSGSFTHYGMPHTPHLIKLHGSINWYWSGRSPTDTIFCHENFSKEQDILGLRPCIVPPVMDKTQFYDHVVLRGLWEIAERKLRKADNIYIIGFSFPPTDLSVRFLFQSALRNKSPQIYVVNTDTSEGLKATYKEVLGESDVNYTYCCENAFERFVNERLKNV